MNEGQAPRQFSLERIFVNNIITVEMEPRAAGELPGRTQFRVLRLGTEPIVDIECTDLGRVEDSPMRFIGSIATAELLETNPEDVICGQIVPGYRIVMESIETNRKSVISGRIANKEPIISRGRLSRKTNKYV